MNTSERIAISVPRTLFTRIERLRRRTGENRSALVQRALHELLRAEERSARVQVYVDGYRKSPETPAEVQAAVASAAALFFALGLDR